VSGRTVPTREQPRRPGDPPELVANAQRAHDVLGWQPRYPDLGAMIESAWRWHTSGVSSMAASAAQAAR
jgi:UDP-glucose 4-epimerase